MKKLTITAAMAALVGCGSPPEPKPEPEVFQMFTLSNQGLNCPTYLSAMDQAYMFGILQKPQIVPPCRLEEPDLVVTLLEHHPNTIVSKVQLGRKDVWVLSFQLKPLIPEPPVARDLSLREPINDLPEANADPATPTARDKMRL